MKNKHISFPEYEATVTVAENCPQEIIDALKKMCHLAYYNLGNESHKAEEEFCDHYNVVVPTAGDFYCPKCDRMVNWYEHTIRLSESKNK